MAAPHQREFPGTPAAPAEARTFVTAAVAELLAAPVEPLDSGAITLRDDLELVVSELVTNAVRAGSPVVRVDVTTTPDHAPAHILVRVEDEGTGWPEPRQAGVHDVNGRGLALVSALCSSWGVRLGEAGGKVVWAQLEVRRAG